MSTKLNDLKKEVDILEMVMELDNNDIELFHRWYTNHPYSLGIRELQQIVRNQTDRRD